MGCLGKTPLVAGGLVRRLKLPWESAVQAFIRVSSRRLPGVPVRPVTLAAAAVILAGGLVALWLVGHTSKEPRSVPPPGKVATMAATEGRGGGASADESFARWAAPYRRLQIPLVPIEEAACYNPPEIRPALPDMAAR